MGRLVRIVTSTLTVLLLLPVLVLLPASGAGADAAARQVFAAWGDQDYYVPFAGGRMESPLGPLGWSLPAGSQLTTPNEPWKVWSAGDTRSLLLSPAGAGLVVVTDPYASHVRLFYRSPASASATLSITMTATNPRTGRLASTRAVLSSSRGAWALSGNLAVPDVRDGGTQTLVVVLAATGGSWLIDDLSQDPWVSR